MRLDTWSACFKAAIAPYVCSRPQSTCVSDTLALSGVVDGVSTLMLLGTAPSPVAAPTQSISHEGRGKSSPHPGEPALSHPDGSCPAASRPQATKLGGSRIRPRASDKTVPKRYRASTALLSQNGLFDNSPPSSKPSGTPAGPTNKTPKHRRPTQPPTPANTLTSQSTGAGPSSPHSAGANRTAADVATVRHSDPPEAGADLSFR
jgi:hypothetical protein